MTLQSAQWYIHVQLAIKDENDQLNLILAAKTDLTILGPNESIRLSLLLLWNVNKRTTKYNTVVHCIRRSRSQAKQQFNL